MSQRLSTKHFFVISMLVCQISMITTVVPFLPLLLLRLLFLSLLSSPLPASLSSSSASFSRSSSSHSSSSCCFFLSSCLLLRLPQTNLTRGAGTTSCVWGTHLIIPAHTHACMHMDAHTHTCTRRDVCAQTAQVNGLGCMAGWGFLNRFSGSAKYQWVESNNLLKSITVSHISIYLTYVIIALWGVQGDPLYLLPYKNVNSLLEVSAKPSTLFSFFFFFFTTMTTLFF